MAGGRVKDDDTHLAQWVFSFGEDGHEDPRPLRKVEGPGVGADAAMTSGFVSTGSTN